MDRPLRIAGRALVRAGERIETRLVRLDGQLLIPNVAIHMNREINSGFAPNLQTDMLPLYGDGAAKGELARRLAESLLRLGPARGVLLLWADRRPRLRLHRPHGL